MSKGAVLVAAGLATAAFAWFTSRRRAGGMIDLTSDSFLDQVLQESPTGSITMPSGAIIEIPAGVFPTGDTYTGPPLLGEGVLFAGEDETAEEALESGGLCLYEGGGWGSCQEIPPAHVRIADTPLTLDDTVAMYCNEVLAGIPGASERWNASPFREDAWALIEFKGC